MALVMYAKAPGSIKWDDGEVEDVNMYQLCLLLHKTPAEVETISIKHASSILATKAANNQIKADHATKQQRRRKR